MIGFDKDKKCYVAEGIVGVAGNAKIWAVKLSITENKKKTKKEIKSKILKNDS